MQDRWQFRPSASRGGGRSDSLVTEASNDLVPQAAKAAVFPSTSDIASSSDGDIYQSAASQTIELSQNQKTAVDAIDLPITLNISLSKVLYFEAVTKAVKVVYDTSQEFELTESLDALEAELESKGFVRLHRSFLVRLLAIEECNAKHVVLKNGFEISLRRGEYRLLRDAFLEEPSVLVL